VNPLLSLSLQKRHFTEERLAALQKEGVIDPEGWTAFNTLHELRLSACHAFYDHDLFGTYTVQENGEGAYKWMTYEDFGAIVEKTRAVLNDLGKLSTQKGVGCV
jgi:hypothetical protein